MLSKSMVAATLPAKNMDRAKKFYSEKLGFKPGQTFPDGSVLYQCKESAFLVYPSEFAGTAKNTALGWATDDVEREVKELRSKGVVFEEYDMPGLKTVNGIATMGDIKAAWFKDSEGNILAINKM
jgi:catechol 2,3-dioxygenase-like lactoylglutathione lyase family enzyme